MTENKEALNVVDLSIEIEELESKIAPDDDISVPLGL
jgi:hypothetical protein